MAESLLFTGAGAGVWTGEKKCWCWRIVPDVLRGWTPGLLPHQMWHGRQAPLHLGQLHTHPLSRLAQTARPQCLQVRRRAPHRSTVKFLVSFCGESGMFCSGCGYDSSEFCIRNPATWLNLYPDPGSLAHFWRRKNMDKQFLLKNISFLNLRK